MQQSVTFQVNGKTYTEICSPGTTLLSLLRSLGWVGVHRGCDTGDCGCCTVWVDDTPIHSCLYPAMRIDSHQVTTIEGLAPPEQLAPMQEAFLAKQGFQCGFCTAGTIMSATKFNYETEAELRQALKGNLCRCTGYQAIVDSILKAETPKLDSLFPSPQPPAPSPLVGQNIPKQDGLEIVTGKASYTADRVPSGLLHLKVLRSPHPHARIRQIDATKARALAGVCAVFTHEDVVRRPYTTAGHAEPVPDPLDHYLLDNKVRFVGDRVAAVVAESSAIADFACSLITVDYEILPHVTNPVAAMEGGVVIHDEPDSQQIPDRQRNIAGEVFLEYGDIEAGFAASDLIVENTYHLPAAQHVHLEPHVSISWLEPDGTLVVRSSTQVPFHCQRILSEIFDLPKDKIRVYKAQLGGGFGNKQEILTEDLCVLATLRTGRPVQWELSRYEEFTATNSRHAMTIRVKTGVKADGTLVAQDIEAIANTGAYGNHGKTVVFLAGYIPLCLYRCPHKRFQGLAVYTNIMPAGAFRGYGATQGTFAIDTQMDEIAFKLGVDAVEFRLKNLIRSGDVLSFGRCEDHFNAIGSYALDECFEKVIHSLGYVPGTPPIVEGSRRRGVGFAVSMQGSGLSKIHLASVKLSLLANGKFELRTGSVDVGTGSDTTLRQIAAEVLGVSVADVEIISGDTELTPFDAGSYASATVYISGQAVRLAAMELRGRLENEPQRREGRKGGGECLSVEVSHAADESSLTFAVQGVEVEVDTDTGKVRVLRCVQAIDLGKAINPQICIGQATGGVAMGFGYALMEELLFDELGRVVNPRLRDYRIPVAADLPPMEVILVEKADPYGPFGAKGMGEITTNCTAPAIANAVAYATGIRLRELPMTPEKVWQRQQL